MGSDLFTHKDHPDVMIRVTSCLVFDHDSNGNLVARHGKNEAMELELTLQGLVLARELFRELEGDYGIPTVGFTPLVGRDNIEPYRPAVFVVSRKIRNAYTPALDPVAEPLPGSMMPAGRELVYKLSTYIKRKCVGQEPMLDDVFKPTNYLYDYDAGKFVLADMDPWLLDDGGFDPSERYMWLHDLAAQCLSLEEFNDWLQEMQDLDDATESFERGGETEYF